jgi:Mrp family chromosome partitioning ATPase
MQKGDARLREAGLDPGLLDEQPALRDECARAARRLVHAGRRVIGLLPSSDRVAVPPIGVQLGLALADLSGTTVAFVDTNLRWPALPREVVDAADAGEAQEAFSTRWLRGSLALVVAPRGARGGAGVLELGRVLDEGSELFGCVLVDLTGLKRLGEHLDAIRLVDGVVIVARAGETTEGELLRLRHELPIDKNLGILLTGADQAHQR